mmetsp:Transcript_513/g.1731  ORF Transcript_513/g.1731 Transcript_513/m.1731 type:complete len:278 (-) Transcript_513:1306-2139(-)
MQSRRPRHPGPCAVPVRRPPRPTRRRRRLPSRGGGARRGTSSPRPCVGRHKHTQSATGRPRGRSGRLPSKPTSQSTASFAPSSRRRRRGRRLLNRVCSRWCGLVLRFQNPTRKCSRPSTQSPTPRRRVDTPRSTPPSGGPASPCVRFGRRSTCAPSCPTRRTLTPLLSDPALNKKWELCVPPTRPGSCPSAKTRRKSQKVRLNPRQRSRRPPRETSTRPLPSPGRPRWPAPPDPKRRAAAAASARSGNCGTSGRRSTARCHRARRRRGRCRRRRRLR